MRHRNDGLFESGRKISRGTMGTEEVAEARSSGLPCGTGVAAPVKSSRDPLFLFRRLHEDAARGTHRL
jgi:hypothetical protein